MNWFRGFGILTPPIFLISVCLAVLPYNNVSTAVLHCDCRYVYGRQSYMHAKTYCPDDVLPRFPTWYPNICWPNGLSSRYMSPKRLLPKHPSTLWILHCCLFKRHIMMPVSNKPMELGPVHTGLRLCSMLQNHMLHSSTLAHATSCIVLLCSIQCHTPSTPMLPTKFIMLVCSMPHRHMPSTPGGLFTNVSRGAAATQILRSLSSLRYDLFTIDVASRRSWRAYDVERSTEIFHWSMVNMPWRKPWRKRKPVCANDKNYLMSCLLKWMRLKYVHNVCVEMLDQHDSKSKTW